MQTIILFILSLSTAISFAVEYDWKKEAEYVAGVSLKQENTVDPKLDLILEKIQ